MATTRHSITIRKASTTFDETTKGLTSSSEANDELDNVLWDLLLESVVLLKSINSGRRLVLHRLLST
jgi:hypothetical protein